MFAPRWDSISRAPPRGFRAQLFRRFPAIDALRIYSGRSFASDLFAGLTVATVVVPQGLAYAIAAGLPPQYGLYTAIVTTAIGALFDSSKQLINGPTNALSIALFSALGVMPEEQRMEIAFLLSFLVGFIQLGITLLKLGDLTRYVSHSVIVGFTLGAAILLFLGQLRVTLGVPEGGSANQSFLVRTFLTYASGPKVNLWTLAIAAGTVATTLLLQRINKLLSRFGRFRLPEFLIAVIASGFAVYAFDLKKNGVAVIGALPEHLPAFHPPHVTLVLVQEHASQALAIALLGLLEAVAMAKAIAAHTRQRLDISQQCLSEALANLGGSMFQCFPGSGSLTRSAVNHQSGAVSQWSGFISALAVAACIILFAPLGAYVPRSAIAGILIITAFRLVDQRDLSYFVRTSRFDTIIVLVTAACAVAISVEFCLIVGVFISFVMYVPRAGQIHMTELVVVGDRTIREKQRGDPHCGKLGIFAFEGEMFFGAVPDLEKHLDYIDQQIQRGARVVLLRVRELRNPDAVCVQLLDQWIHHAKRLGAQVMLVGLRDDLGDCMIKSGAADRLGRENMFYALQGPPSGLVRAVERAYQILGDDRCETCPRNRTVEGQAPERGAWVQQI